MKHCSTDFNADWKTSMMQWSSKWWYRMTMLSSDYCCSSWLLKSCLEPLCFKFILLELGCDNSIVLDENEVWKLKCVSFIEQEIFCGYELLAGYEFNRYILVWNAECEICYYRNSKAKHWFYVSTSRILGILLFQ